ncbi:MAG TPA: hypothetical protein VFU47_04905 [Armatimonadota bacterium]|nr:hypothetical protein [Armatimonadota bacterium]
MRFDGPSAAKVQTDNWLITQCRSIEAAGTRLTEVVGEANSRVEQERAGELGRRQRVTESQLREAEAACAALHETQVAVQNALFDCEHELRALREREISPAELLIDGERLILQYRFFRRRARILDGLLAYLPLVNSHAVSCLEGLRALKDGGMLDVPLTVPDCGFALVALDQLDQESVPAG